MKKPFRLSMVFLFGLGLVMLLLLALGWQLADPATVFAGTGRYVATSGADSGDCSNSSTPCRTVQYAVDQASADDQVYIAQGSYTAVSNRPVPAWYQNPPSSGLIAQAVYISKSITLVGGFTTTNWTISDPEAHPTTLDAQNNGRVVFIDGSHTVWVEGLRLAQGNALGLGGYGGYPTSPPGGGVYAYQSTLTLTNCEVISNTAQYAAGLWLYQSTIDLQNNTIIHNYASIDPGSYGSACGGLYMTNGSGTIKGNQIIDNRAESAGGIFLYNASPTIEDNYIAENRATAMYGGGLEITDGSPQLNRNVILDNRAHIRGGGVSLSHDSSSWDNNVIADNQIWLGTSPNCHGAGVYMNTSSAVFDHTTIAGNVGCDGRGVYIATLGTPSFRNSIIVDHDVGIQNAGGQTASVNGVLWYNNSVTNTQGSVNITAGSEVTGDPVFDIDGYHLTAGSAAIDAVLTTQLSDDLDGETRSGTHDLGADEYIAGMQVSKYTIFNTVQAGDALTFTIQIINSSAAVTLHAHVTDTLPSQVTPSGVQNFHPVVAPGNIWRQHIKVTANVDFVGTLTNTVVVSSDEGPSGSDQAAVEVTAQPIAGLAATNDSPTSLGSQTTLTATVSQGTSPAYTWSPGDGSGEKSGQVISHQYTNPGVYTAIVTASNVAGSMQASTIVTVGQGTAEIGPGESGQISSPGGEIVLGFPAGLAAETVTITLTQQISPTETAGDMLFAGIGFHIEAALGSGDPITQFLQPFTITINYEDSDWQDAGIADETSLNLAFYDSASTSWVDLLPCSGCWLDTGNNVLVAVLDHLTEFAVFGQEASGAVYLPCVVKK